MKNYSRRTLYKGLNVVLTPASKDEDKYIFNPIELRQSHLDVNEIVAVLDNRINTMQDAEEFNKVMDLMKPEGRFLPLLTIGDNHIGYKEYYIAYLPYYRSIFVCDTNKSYDGEHLSDTRFQCAIEKLNIEFSQDKLNQLGASNVGCVKVNRFYGAEIAF